MTNYKSNVFAGEPTKNFYALHCNKDDLKNK